MDLWEIITVKDLIIAIVAAASAIIGVVLVEIVFGKRTYSLLEKHNDKSGDYKETLSKEHSDLSKEHSDLSKDHNNIKANQKLIYNMQKETDDKIIKINDMLLEDKVHQEYLRANLNNHQTNMKESFDNINAIFEDWKKQIIIIERLQEQLDEKDIEIERLIDENKKLKRSREHNRDTR